MSALASALTTMMVARIAGGVRRVFGLAVGNVEGIRKEVVLWRQASWLPEAAEDREWRSEAGPARRAAKRLPRGRAGSPQSEWCTRGSPAKEPSRRRHRGSR